MTKESGVKEYKPLKWGVSRGFQSEPKYEETDGPNDNITYKKFGHHSDSEKEAWNSICVGMGNEDRTLLLFELSNKNLIKDDEPCKMNYKILLINKKNNKIHVMSVDPDSYDD